MIPILTPAESAELGRQSRDRGGTVDALMEDAGPAVAREAIEALNVAASPVVAVDIPSGVDGESGSVQDEAVLAEVTVTMGTLKPGLVFFPGAAHTGIPVVADIGFPPDLLDSQLWLME